MRKNHPGRGTETEWAQNANQSRSFDFISIYLLSQSRELRCVNCQVEIDVRYKKNRALWSNIQISHRVASLYHRYLKDPQSDVWFFLRAPGLTEKQFKLGLRVVGRQTRNKCASRWSRKITTVLIPFIQLEVYSSLTASIGYDRIVLLRFLYPSLYP